MATGQINKMEQWSDTRLSYKRVKVKEARTWGPKIL
jgi:hypothetical protein